MKNIIISSNSSGGGKTTFTLGLMKTLIKRGYTVQGYKVGPDYIDPAFHSLITGKPSRNLDPFLMGEEGVLSSFNKGEGDMGIIEGVMGLYDGIGITTDNSTYHISKLLDIPVILLITPKAQSTTLCAEIKGMMEFKNVNIGGIVLNNISESYYNLLKAGLEKHLKIKVFGYLPKEEKLSLKSRHLGLVQGVEIEDLEEKIDIASKLIEENIDIDNMISCFKEISLKKERLDGEKKDLNIGVALDKAFSFYYKDNLESLEKIGNIIYFSPLEDSSIPDNLDFIYIGGGYPEVFIETLSKNKSMRESIRESLNSGLPCYAECGGLMYLMESIDGYETVGFFKGKAYMTGKLQNFGYSNITVFQNNNILPKGFSINCHEFHKSTIESSEKKIYRLSKTNFQGIEKTWECGYIKKNTIGSYAHINFLGNREILKYLTKRV